MAANVQGAKITPELQEKLCTMIRSGNKEMCELAFTIFVGLTNRYEDYFYLRSIYSEATFLTKEPEKTVFNRLYNHVDKEGINELYRVLMKKWSDSKLRGSPRMVRRNTELLYNKLTYGVRQN